jgi:translation initiation factor IF-1
MPTKAGNSTKTLSRMAIIRQNANKKMVDAAINGDLEDGLYGRVIKNLGGSMMTVLTQDKREHRAQIRGLLRRKGATPISVGDVVILSRREFESRAGEAVVDSIGAAEVFDIIGIMDHRTALKAVKDGLIPKWMLVGADEKGGGESSGEDDGFDFAYEGAPLPPAEGEDAEAAARKAKEARLEKRAALKGSRLGGAGADDDHIDIDNI